MTIQISFFNINKYYDVIFVNAKTMSGLHRFKLLGIFLVSVGFLAILDGCPLLEFLDLHVCASLSQNLEQRCHEQIKDLRPPKHFLYYDDGGHIYTKKHFFR
ncbi:hypothetical protein MtrunA17_Chr8g0335491 [Medicago truncatula]|uniref:Transmembrane protein n=1 Tax=Medicago truncatula TaxID=3880 RepID=A0A396GB75_MEDTR|nr:hypothetical protein MtrunA17_Chr8g0335491 [Medicago truncatula]